MKRLLLEGHDATVARFVADLSPIERPVFTEGDRAFGILRDDGALIGGVVFSQWKPQFRTLEISAATVSSACFSTPIVRILGDYVFEQLKAYRLFARTSTRNRRATEILIRLGFTREGTQGHYYGPTHAASLWRLLQPEWERKWLPKREQQAA